jgi:uncharacterized small protein (DUF1192 family)
MQRGQGVVWVPARRILSTVTFPEKRTFDSSRTPKRGESKRTAELKPINLDKLQERLATVKAEIDANDPKALRAEITRLKAELAKKTTEPTADPVAIEAADRHGFERGYRRGFEDAKKQGTTAFEGLKAMVRSTMQSFATSFDGNVRGETIGFEMVLQQSGSPAALQAADPKRQPAVPPAARQSSPSASGDGNLSGPEQRIINALATWASWGQLQPSNSQVAWLAGYSPSSSSYANPRGALKAKGLLEYPAPDVLQLTPEGAAAGVPMEMSGSLVDLVLSKLSGPEARILRAVAQLYPNSATNEEAATIAGYSPTSSSYANPRGALKSKELISYPSQGCVRAADWLFSA